MGLHDAESRRCRITLLVDLARSRRLRAHIRSNVAAAPAAAAPGNALPEWDASTRTRGRAGVRRRARGCQDNVSWEAASGPPRQAPESAMPRSWRHAVNGVPAGIIAGGASDLPSPADWA